MSKEIKTFTKINYPERTVPTVIALADWAMQWIAHRRTALKAARLTGSPYVSGGKSVLFIIKLSLISNNITPE
jgi:hypothetical protein